MTIWSVGVIVSSFVVEMIGEKTGIIFGNYHYCSVLKPVIRDVPLAIGFAWLNILLASMAVAAKLRLKSPFLLITVTALLMLAFDVVMEPAAVHLKYWTWSDGIITLRNYLAWLLLGFFYAWSGFLINVHRNLSNFVFHTFIAQFLYFFIITLFLCDKTDFHFHFLM